MFKVKDSHGGMMKEVTDLKGEETKDPFLINFLVLIKGTEV